MQEFPKTQQILKDLTWPVFFAFSGFHTRKETYIAILEGKVLPERSKNGQGELDRYFR